FSSRRRHTRFSRDWSSDVCSSDLGGVGDGVAVGAGTDRRERDRAQAVCAGDLEAAPVGAGKQRGLAVLTVAVDRADGVDHVARRSEERRVGKEGRGVWWANGAEQM